MSLLNPQSGPGLDWSGSRPRLGLVHGFLYNLCNAVSSCFYVFCCCWLIEDCCLGQRTFPGPPFGQAEAPPPPPPFVEHTGHGLLGPILGQPGPPGPPPPPGPFGYSGPEPAPF